MWCFCSQSVLLGWEWLLLGCHLVLPLVPPLTVVERKVTETNHMLCGVSECVCMCVSEYVCKYVCVCARVCVCVCMWVCEACKLGNDSRLWNRFREDIRHWMYELQNLHCWHVTKLLKPEANREADTGNNTRRYTLTLPYTGQFTQLQEQSHNDDKVAAGHNLQTPKSGHYCSGKLITTSMGPNYHLHTKGREL